jgi:ABC-2 type transport system permease protein
MNSSLNKAYHFLRRDFLINLSYKFSFFYQIGGLLSSTITLYFISMMVRGKNIESLSRFGGDYFTFSLIGVAFLDYMWISMEAFAQEIRIGQLMGTLEAMFVTPTSPAAIIFCSTFYTYARTILRTMIYLLTGFLFFGAQIEKMNFISTFLNLIATIACFSGLGILAAALTLYLKNSWPVTSLIGGISFLFGGIVYPVESMPSVLQRIAWTLPMTHSAEGFRKALIHGASLSDIMPNISILLLWSVMIFPFSFFVLKKVINFLKKEGSFGAY